MITNVDVVVTDRSGKPVRGLTADDFEIREDGKLQTITNFTAFDATSTAARAEEPEDLETAQAASAKLPRLIVLFVDIGDIEPSRRQRFFSSVESFLDKALRDGDLVTVLTWNHRVHTLLAPTADRKRVEIVLNGFSEPYGKREVKIFRALAEQSAVQSERDAEISSELGTAIETDAVAESEFQEWLLAEERCQMIKRKARELRNVLTSLSRVEMRKVVIVASDDLSLQPADDCLTGPDLEKLAVTANAYGMTIHAFHPPGPRDSFIGPDQGGFLRGRLLHLRCQQRMRVRKTRQGADAACRTHRRSHRVRAAKRNGAATGCSGTRFVLLPRVPHIAWERGRASKDRSYNEEPEVSCAGAPVGRTPFGGEHDSRSRNLDALPSGDERAADSHRSMSM